MTSLQRRTTQSQSTKTRQICSIIGILCEFERKIAHFLQFYYLPIVGLTLTDKLARLTVSFFYLGFYSKKACSLQKLICMQI